MLRDLNTKLLLAALFTFCFGAVVFDSPARHAARVTDRDQAPDVENFTPRQAQETELATKEENVAFNEETLKYHCLDCKWAIRCTKNCREIPISEARRLGGVACKVCGGSCR
ncbi:MAG TPA: hypothetical protein VGS22_07075 [Thermoanaerobaculia bacterium]|jgi:hypothetical protein|nr:hypothetical protein [Thermoanaerobaculia bacterium]